MAVIMFFGMMNECPSIIRKWRTSNVCKHQRSIKILDEMYRWMWLKWGMLLITDVKGNICWFQNYKSKSLTLFFFILKYLSIIHQIWGPFLLVDCSATRLIILFIRHCIGDFNSKKLFLVATLDTIWPFQHLSVLVMLQSSIFQIWVQKWS